MDTDNNIVMAGLGMWGRGAEAGRRVSVGEKEGTSVIKNK